MAKRDIGGNTYLVIVIPSDDVGYSHHVTVHGDKKHGKDKGFPDGTYGYEVRDKYDYLTGTKVRDNKELAPVVAKAVNAAIGELTGHLEQTKSKEDAVLGALEANADAHESDE